MPSSHFPTGYHTQPHVALDAILATLSLGPVGISDGLNLTDAGLIGQAFRSATDSTLLRPSRPLSTVDSVFTNKSRSLSSTDAGTNAGGAGSVDCKTTRLGAGNTPSAVDIRSTHAALEGAGDFVSHYVLAWMPTRDATLQATDLYPPPSATAMLAVRPHIITPYGAAQYAGCVDGEPASRGCITVLPVGVLPTIKAVGDAITDFSYTAIYEPLSNGAYFLGELEKFVHVSPQRYASVVVGGSGACGVTATVKGTVGEQVKQACVDAAGTVHVTTATVNAAGRVAIEF